jgi:hypothetical protein
MRRLLSVASGLALACASRAVAGDGGSPASAPSPSSNLVTYDRAVQKSVHNAYDRAEPLYDQLVWHRVRSLELDIHVGKAGAAAASGDWFVYHEDLPLLRNTSCTMLGDCLDQLAAFHASTPKHEVVTLWVDLKDDFGAGHTPADLDALLAQRLGREAIVTPRDLVDRCPGAETVRGAVTGSCAFPTLRELEGKLIVAVTGGTACDDASFVSTYGGAAPRDRLAFLAPNVGAACSMPSYDARPDIAFLNMTLDERARAAEARSRGLVARIYKGGVRGGLDDAADFEAARAAGAQHLATDEVNAEVHRWSTSPSPPGSEGASLLGIRTASGDIADRADSFYFAYENDPGAATWSSSVSVASSHVEPAAKACLMARADATPEAANVALCRTFDQHPPRMQVRRAAGAETTEAEMTGIGGVSAEAPAFLRLTLTPIGAGTEATGEASSDGKTWTTIGKVVSSGALPLRGIATASRGPLPVRALFGNVVRARGGASVVHRAASLPLRAAIGAGSGGHAFDGVGP